MLRALLRPTGVVGAVALVLLAVGTLAQALLQGAVVPDLDLVLRMATASSGVALPLAIWAAGLAGAAAGGRALRDEGVVLGLGTLGVPRSRIVSIVGVYAAGVVLAGLAASHVAEPTARALLRDARVAAAVRVDPVAGRTLALGTWAVTVEGGRLQFAGDGAIGSAGTWSVRPAAAGVIAELRDVVVHAPDRAWTAGIDHLVVPVALPGTSGKVAVTERSTPDFVAQLRAHPGDRYERWILWKRTVLPLALAPLVLGGFGLGAARRGPVAGVVGGLAVALWVAVRLCDQAIQALDAPLAAVLVLGGAAVAGALGLRRWA